MTRYKVSVEKRGYKTGYVYQYARTPEEAEERVIKRINIGDLQTITKEIVWNEDEYEYEDDSFITTGTDC